MFEVHLLSWLLVIPLLGGLGALFFPRNESSGVIGWGFVATCLNAICALGVWVSFDPQITSLQLTESHVWIESLGISYSLGVDALSLGLVVLTALVFPWVLIASRRAISRQAREWVVCLLFLEASVMGALLATDLFLFYVCFEAMLVPSLVLMVLYSDVQAAASARKFFIYTMFGSMLLLVALLLTGQLARDHDALSFSWSVLTERLWSRPQGPIETWLFVGFAAAFAIKVALFPLHTWMPSAYRHAPAPVCALLSAILLKVGAYGFLRHALWLFPRTAAVWLPLLGVLAAITILWGALMAAGAQDVKELLAYSSMSHLGFVLLGIASMTRLSILGGTLEMVSHGAVTCALFLMVGYLEERLKTTQLNEMGGLARALPNLACFLTLFAMASVGLPGLSGFIGEFLVLLGSYQAPTLAVSLPTHTVMMGLVNTVAVLGAIAFLLVVWRLTRTVGKNNEKPFAIWDQGVWLVLVAAFYTLFAAPPLPGFAGGLLSRWVQSEFRGVDSAFVYTARASSLVALLGVVFSAMYTLRFVSGVLYGPARAHARGLGDLSAKELCSLLPFALGVLWIGLYPATLSDKLSPGLEAYVREFRVQAHMNPEPLASGASRRGF